MADTFELEVGATNPYIITRLYQQDGRAFFGIWNPPEVRIDGDEEIITVRMGEEGQLDLFARRVYGDRRLWRVIAQANRIGFPLRDVTAGMKLIIPKFVNVQAALRALVRSGRQA